MTELCCQIMDRKILRSQHEERILKKLTTFSGSLFQFKFIKTSELGPALNGDVEVDIPIIREAVISIVFKIPAVFLGI